MLEQKYIRRNSRDLIKLNRSVFDRVSSLTLYTRRVNLFKSYRKLCGYVGKRKSRAPSMILGNYS